MFDCYNTLLFYRSDEEKAGIWEMMLSAVEYVTEHTVQATPEELERLYQNALQREIECCQKERGIHAEICLTNVWKDVLLDLDIPEEMAEEKAEDFLLLFRLYTRKQKRLFANVERELMRLKQEGIRLLLLSNAQNCFIYNELPKKVRDLFDEVFISESMGIKKPSEEWFRQAFAKLGVQPSDTVFVGDSAEDDMIPAGRLGCHCVMITKKKPMNKELAHVHVFDPHQDLEYKGMADLIMTLS